MAKKVVAKRWPKELGGIKVGRETNRNSYLYD
jgi:hypothetical protein